MPKLQPLLSEYLLENKSLPLQDTGCLFIRSQAAFVMEESGTISPPQASLAFSSEKPAPAALQNLVDFISKQLSISVQQAAELMDREGKLPTAFAEDQDIDWASFGPVKSQQHEAVSYQATNALNMYLPVILLQPNKLVQVAQAIVQSSEPEPVIEQEYTLPEPVQKDYWWVWAILILVVSIVLILFRYV